MAELTAPVMKSGRVILPVGAVLQGRVTEVHGGRMISGAAMMRLDPAQRDAAGWDAAYVAACAAYRYQPELALIREWAC